MTSTNKIVVELELDKDDILRSERLLTRGSATARVVFLELSKAE